MLKNKYYQKIQDYLLNRPRQYIKIDNLRIDLLAPKSATRITAFDRAYQDLVACGRLEICGNEIRINN